MKDRGERAVILLSQHHGAWRLARLANKPHHGMKNCPMDDVAGLVTCKTRSRSLESFIRPNKDALFLNNRSLSADTSALLTSLITAPCSPGHMLNCPLRCVGRMLYKVFTQQKCSKERERKRERERDRDTERERGVWKTGK